MLSIGPEEAKLELLDTIKQLLKLGFRLYATNETYQYYTKRGIRPINKVEKIRQNSQPEKPTLIELLQNKVIELVINIPNTINTKKERTVGYQIRRTAVDFGIGLITNTKSAILLVDAMQGKS